MAPTLQAVETRIEVYEFNGTRTLRGYVLQYMIAMKIVYACVYLIADC